jgi:hypothetical protein
MPTNLPVRASGSHEMKRPRPLPRAVRDACLIMIYGKPDDPDATPLDFTAAARLVGIRPNIMRKWLHKPAVISLIRAERRAFRNALCCANEAALAGIRDHAVNAMAKVAAIRQLEELEQTTAHRSSDADSVPHVTIRIVNAVNSPAPAPAVVTTIDANHDVDGFRIDSTGHRIDEETGQRIFTPPSPY